MQINAKYNKLLNILGSYPGVVIAFSGGVDSSLLLAASREVLGPRVLAVTAASPLYPAEETALARRICRRFGVRHIVIRTREMDLPQFRKNPRDRCFHCKWELFTDLLKVALPLGYQVIEGANRSDRADFRPGSKAARDLGIASPLDLAGLAKSEIRRLARRLGLPNWNKPAMACLASRIPYGCRIDRPTIQRIAAAESYVRRYVTDQIRVRDHFPICRIEVAPQDFRRIISRRTKIIKYLKKLGYTYVTLDMSGYQTGSMNL